MTPPKMDGKEFYGWVHSAHTRLFQEFDLGHVESWKLDQMLRLMPGAHAAMRELEKTARAELKKRGEKAWSVPLRLVAPWEGSEL